MPRELIIIVGCIVRGVYAVFSPPLSPRRVADQLSTLSSPSYPAGSLAAAGDAVSANLTSPWLPSPVEPWSASCRLEFAVSGGGVEATRRSSAGSPPWLTVSVLTDDEFSSPRTVWTWNPDVVERISRRSDLYNTVFI